MMIDIVKEPSDVAFEYKGWSGIVFGDFSGKHLKSLYSGMRSFSSPGLI